MGERAGPYWRAQHEPRLPSKEPMCPGRLLVAAGLLGAACCLSSVVGCQRPGDRRVEEGTPIGCRATPPQWADSADTVVWVSHSSGGAGVPRVTAVLARDGKPVVRVPDVYPLARGVKHTLLVRTYDKDLRMYVGLVTWDEAKPSGRWLLRMREREFVLTGAISPDGAHIAVTSTVFGKPPRHYCRTGSLREGGLRLSGPVSTDTRPIRPIWWRDSRHVFFEALPFAEDTGGKQMSTVRVLDTQTSRSWPLIRLRSSWIAWTVPDSRDGLLLTGQEPSGRHVILRVRDDLHGVDTLYTWQEDEETVNAQVSPSGDTLAIRRFASDSAGRLGGQTVLRDLRSGTEVVRKGLLFRLWQGDTFLAHQSPGSLLGCYSAEGRLLWSWSPIEGAGPSPRPEG